MWQFEVKQGRESEFEELYGVEGEWTVLVYEQHRAFRSDAIESLEQRSQALIDSVEPLGIFSALNVPDRFGPTWSQRHKSD
jgi:hypothetical protein